MACYFRKNCRTLHFLPGTHPAELHLAVILLNNLRRDLPVGTCWSEEVPGTDSMKHRLEDFRDRTGTVVMCMYCKRSQRHPPSGPQWVEVEEFIANRPVKVSHGLCPECLEKHHPAE